MRLQDVHTWIATAADTVSARGNSADALPITMVQLIDASAG